MPRKPRVEYAGAVYHVMCRGNRQEAIFLDDADRERFLETLWECCGRTGWRIHAYVLMGNHYHLLLETPESNLVTGMRWMQGTYTIRFNARHRLRGHLFQGRYKALPVEPDNQGYFLQVSSYIHLNPVRARLLDTSTASLEAYSWSSYPDYLRPSSRRRGLVIAEQVLGELGLEDNGVGRRKYRAHLEAMSAALRTARGRQAQEEQWQEIRRGWYLGSERFRDRLLKHVDEVMKPSQRKSFSGAEAIAHDEAAAGDLAKAGLQALNLTDNELGQLPKLDVRKQVLSWWIRQQTVASNRWLARRLQMGDDGNVSKAIRLATESRSPAVRKAKSLLARKAIIPISED